MADRLRALSVAPALGVGVLYLLLLGAKLALEPAARFIGDGGRDAWGTQWFYWLIGRRLRAGEPFAHTDLLFHPWGKDVYAHTGGNVLDAALALPLRWLFGPVLGYDLFVLGIVVANGLAVYALCRSLRFGRGAAAGGGLLGAFNPYVLGELSAGRPTQALLVFAVLAVAALVSLEEEPSWKRVAAAAIFLALSGLNYWFHAIFVVLGLAPFVGILLVERGRGAFVVLARAGAALALSALLVLPLAFPMLADLGGDAVPGLLAVQDWGLGGWSPRTVEGWEIGIEALRLPDFQVVVHHLSGGELLAEPLHRGLAWTQLALVLGGLVLASRQLRRRLLALFLVALVLSTGPQLVEGVVDPLYLLLLEVAPPLKRLWWPARAIFLLQIAAAIAAAVVIRRAPERWRGLVGAGLFALVGVELWLAKLAPLTTVSAEVPELVGCLAEAEGAILEVPLDGNPERLHWQAVHGRPIFGGMIDDNPVFVPAGHLEFREQNRFVQSLEALGRGQPMTEVDPAAVDAVEALGVRWLVLDTEGLPGGGGRSGRAARRGLQTALGPAVYDDGRFALYSFTGASLSCP